MNNFSKKQKIIIGAIVCIIICLGLYYFYNSDEDFQIIENEANTEEKMENIANKITKEDINLGKIEENKENKEEILNNQVQEKIIVHVSGAVVNEGIVELNEGSRVSDAIKGSGGLKEDANLKDINLAYKLEDGMKIYIPNNVEQKEKTNKNNVIEDNSKINKMEEYITRTEERQVNNVFNNENELKVNINTATQTELETLQGIGPSTALKIINYRKENGKFTSIEAIKEVSGIGDAKFESIKDFIEI